MEVTTVTTRIAVCIANLHRGLRYRILDWEHTSPLPWVFTWIGKENVFTLNVKGTIVLICPFGIVRRELFAKNTWAVVGPEWQSDYRGSLWGWIVRGLVPSEFCAHLVGPLAASVVCGRHNILEVSIVVLIVRDALTSPIYGCSLDLGCHVKCRVADEHVAKFGAFTVLDCARVNVSEHVIEFGFKLIFWDLEHSRESVKVHGFELLFNPQEMLFYNLRALISWSTCARENLKIILFEIFDCLDYPGAGPGTNGVVRVLAMEPSGQSTGVTTSYSYPIGFTADGC